MYVLTTQFEILKNDSTWKYLCENCNLAYLTLQRWKDFNRMLIERTTSTLYP